MSYVHKEEVIVATDIDLGATGDRGDWAPGLRPYIIRGVGLVVTNTIGATGILKLDKRPTAGSDTGRGDGDVAVLNLATTHDQGEVVYKKGLNVLINPGEEVVAEVTDAAAVSDTGHVILEIEQVDEQPANNTKMILST